MTHDDELRRLLHGGPVPAEDERLAQVLRELRETSAAPPAEDVAADHLAAITAAAADAAHEAPSTRAVGPLRRWSRRAAAAGALKIATVATVAAAATGGGLAATGQLPQPVQQQVSDVLSNVGINVPAGEEASTEEQPDDLGTTPAEPAVVESAPPTSTPPTSTPPTEPPAADERTSADDPEQAPTEPDDHPAPLEETLDGEPEDPPSDAGSEYRSDPPTDDNDQAPAGTDEGRSGSAEGDTPERSQDEDAPGDPGSPN